MAAFLTLSVLGRTINIVGELPGDTRARHVLAMEAKGFWMTCYQQEPERVQGE